MKKEYDVAIVGGGPAGLSAAMYLGRENFKVLIIERAAIGGTMAVIPQIDNYPGLASVGGADLSDSMWSQAESFGVEKVASEVEKVVSKNGIIRVVTNNDEYETRALIVATGGSYRKLGIEGEKYAHYCATCDGPFYKGKKIVVIGGANSAFTSAIFLSKFADEVVVAVRGEVTADQITQDDLAKVKNIIVKKGLKVKKIVAENNKVQAVESDDETIETDGVFIFAGHVPSSGWLAGLEVKLDEQGYVQTGEDLMAAPGIFAAGDIRSGNVKQIVVAAGEGAAVAKSVGKFLKN